MKTTVPNEDEFAAVKIVARVEGKVSGSEVSTAEKRRGELGQLASDINKSSKKASPKYTNSSSSSSMDNSNQPTPKKSIENQENESMDISRDNSYHNLRDPVFNRFNVLENLDNNNPQNTETAPNNPTTSEDPAQHNTSTSSKNPSGSQDNSRENTNLEEMDQDSPPNKTPLPDSELPQSSNQKNENTNNTTEIPITSSQQTPGSSTTAPTRTQAQYWCHQCQREITPLMAPNPICPRCNGDFVEEIDPSNDPRDFVISEDEGSETEDTQHPHERTRTDFQSAGGEHGGRRSGFDHNRELIMAIGQLMSQLGGNSPVAPGREGQNTTENVGEGEARTSRGSFGPISFEFSTRSGSSTNPLFSRDNEGERDTEHENGDETTNTEEGTRDRPRTYQRIFLNGVPQTGSFRSESGEEGAAGDQQPPPLFGSGERPLNLEGILSLIFGGGRGGFETFLRGPANLGDYAWGPTGLDDIITQLMEQSQGRNAPPPSSEEAISSLPRRIIDEESLKTNKECGICMEEYIINDKVVSLSCNHEFHEDCILKWLRVNGTCPICRITIQTPEEKGKPKDDQNEPSEPQNLGSSNGNSSSNQHEPRIPGSFPIIMNKDIKLAANYREREEYDNQADLYAILVSLEQLERAFIRDSVSQDEYTTACSKLMSQYKTVFRVVEKIVPNIYDFVKMYKLNCPAALARIEIGIPSTVEHSNYKKPGDSISAKHVAEVVQTYITVMDSIKLSMVAVDNLHPLLGDLIQLLGNLNFIPPDFEGKTKIKEWLIVLNKLRASDELDEEQVRQLNFDLEQSYNAFHRLLDDYK
ncbi:hypothetical protein BB558_003383 [Smittium angustum]|uniref:RING-type E3 ubiquitin transferase n=1 Tax=Smittium angustum TaxID=133377 RepID=A0A2U1J691_SMIAN|nr:hypothetical protein BB558_003383 [Smittium angustum]